jgi:D-arabinose 1-dehydrogenase-like Zn-dependent alcohol dehydrogenase
MMQAAVLNKFKESLEIKQVEIPKPGPDDVLIKTIACGVCHTDLHFIRGGKIKILKKNLSLL